MHFMLKSNHSIQFILIFLWITRISFVHLTFGIKQMQWNTKSYPFLYFFAESPLLSCRNRAAWTHTRGPRPHQKLLWWIAFKCLVLLCTILHSKIFWVLSLKAVLPCNKHFKSAKHGQPSCLCHGFILTKRIHYQIVFVRPLTPFLQCAAYNSM